MRILLERHLIAIVGQGQNVGEGDVVQGKGGCARNATGHVGDTVVHYIVDHIGRFSMCRGSRGFAAAALIDCYIDNDRTRLHGRHHLCCDQFGCSSPWDQHAANHEIGFKHVPFESIPGGKDRVGGSPELLPVGFNDLRTAVNDPDICAHADSDVSRMRADHSGTQYDHFRWVNTRHASE